MMISRQLPCPVWDYKECTSASAARRPKVPSLAAGTHGPWSANGRLGPHRAQCGRSSSGACATARAFLSDHRIVGLVVPLTDAQWARIEPLLPDRTPKRGGRWRDHREVIDAIAWKFQTGSQWVHLPEKYGSWKGAYTRLRNWAIDGT
ncbi:transposase, partial [Kitasatospora purpeofusca]|uniref:transposase n=1 Tax=Kitasatospora purpeofusca TaxID=67352 RepID=UPI0035DA6517